MRNRICPHCNRKIGNVYDRHVANCPLAPQHKMYYRAAMEDAVDFGFLGQKQYYDDRKLDWMSSASSLTHMFRLSWAEIGRLFDLPVRPKKREFEEDANWGMDADTIPQRLPRSETEWQNSLKVLDNPTERVYGGRTFVHYVVR